jgi:CheY-like chemotaxis protein
MIVLIVEDDQMRIGWFKEMYKDDQLFFAQTVEEAKTLLQNQKFERIFLDHDLQGIPFEDSDKETTGAEVVRFMVEKGLQKQADVVVHSNNPPGAYYMCNTLEGAGYNVKYVPFTYLINQIDGIMRGM